MVSLALRNHTYDPPSIAEIRGMASGTIDPGLEGLRRQRDELGGMLGQLGKMVRALGEAPAADDVERAERAMRLKLVNLTIAEHQPQAAWLDAQIFQRARLAPPGSRETAYFALAERRLAPLRAKPLDLRTSPYSGRADVQHEIQRAQQRYDEAVENWRRRYREFCEYEAQERQKVKVPHDLPRD